MTSRIVVTWDEYIPHPGEPTCACGALRDTLITTTVFNDGRVNPYAGNVQSGCYLYGDLIHQAVLSGAVSGGYTVELEDNTGRPVDPPDPFDGPDPCDNE